MKNTISFFTLSALAAACALCGCASHRATIREPKLVVIVSTQQSPAAPAVSAVSDTTAPSDAPFSGDIDSLIESAEAACESGDYPAAHALLKEALQTIKDNDENGDDAEKSYRKIAQCYIESMPSSYEDSIPDEISLVAFRKQLSRSWDTLHISTLDSLMLQKNLSREKASFDIPIVWNDRIYKALYFLNRGGRGPLDKWIERGSYYTPTIKRM
jgi:hypothetical protein